MLRVGFEPTTPVFEQSKAVHALDSAATVIGDVFYYKTLKTKLNFVTLASELYPRSDRRLLAKLVRARGHRNGSPRPLISVL
jgi:hypothetical protein